MALSLRPVQSSSSCVTIIISFWFILPPPPLCVTPCNNSADKRNHPNTQTLIPSSNGFFSSTTPEIHLDNDLRTDPERKCSLFSLCQRNEKSDWNHFLPTNPICYQITSSFSANKSSFQYLQSYASAYVYLPQKRYNYLSHYANGFSFCKLTACRIHWSSANRLNEAWFIHRSNAVGWRADTLFDQVGNGLSETRYYYAKRMPSYDIFLPSRP